MDTEYRAKFKLIGNGNVRRSFENKVKYRRKRREMESNHVPFFWENGVYVSRTPSPKGRRPEKDIGLPGAETSFPRPHISSPSDGQFMPKLDLDLLTPSPPPRRKLQRSFSELEDHDNQIPVMLADAYAQTTLRPQKPRLKDSSSQTPYRWKNNNKENEPLIKHLRSRTPVRLNHRSRSPFAAYGVGDKERTVAGKRTFNVKADGGSQIYESARKTAHARHIPVHRGSEKFKVHQSRRYSGSRNRSTNLIDL